ncbi:MAG: 30S ribosomal protein S9 [Candidatus Micrarchaeia archaeon]
MTEPAAPKKKKAAPKKKKETFAIIQRGKRKRAIARATLTAGSGRITVNRFELSALENPYFAAVINEPLAFFTPEELAKVNVDMIVIGGGVMGQAQACRTALARCLSEHYKDDAIKHAMLEWDRSLLVEDSRRVEPKKFKGPKARARFTKSYR